MTEAIQGIYALLISCLPSLAAILGIVAAAVKIMHKFNALKTAVDDKTDVEQYKKELGEMKIAMTQVLKENAELKVKIDQTLTAINKVDMSTEAPEAKQEV